VGVSLFYDVGFFIMIRLFLRSQLRRVSITVCRFTDACRSFCHHGYLPPHPAPTAIAAMFHADIGKTLVYGIIVAIPAYYFRTGAVKNPE